MAKITKDAFIEGLKEMTILEIKELVDAMKEEFGIDPTAVAVAAPAAGGETGGAEEGPKNVVITAPGAQKVKVIKAVKDITGLGLGEAKALVEEGGVVKEGAKPEEAAELKAQLEELGASVELQ
ncbi:MAG: 50S ribosomal protein L7/L12 [Bacilli bacterium]